MLHTQINLLDIKQYAQHHVGVDSNEAHLLTVLKLLFSPVFVLLLNFFLLKNFYSKFKDKICIYDFFIREIIFF